MEKHRVYYICDRCKKEVNKEDLKQVSDMGYFYELCDDCKALFDEYDKKTQEAEKQLDDMAKEYQFGKYLPKENE